jgi:hypothetical protein
MAQGRILSPGCLDADESFKTGSQITKQVTGFKKNVDVSK